MLSTRACAPCASARVKGRDAALDQPAKQGGGGALPDSQGVEMPGRVVAASREASDVVWHVP